MSANVDPVVTLGPPDYRQTLLSLGLSSKAARAVVHAWPEPASLSGATPGLLKARGLTAGETRRLLGAVELARLANFRRWTAVIRSSRDVSTLLGPSLGTTEREAMAVVLLNTRKEVLDIIPVALGTSTGVRTTPREIYRDAIRAGAVAVILAHNHPSGDTEPSDADVRFTGRVAEAGRVLGIQLLDHVIIAKGGAFSSLADLGII